MSDFIELDCHWNRQLIQILFDRDTWTSLFKRNLIGLQPIEVVLVLVQCARTLRYFDRERERQKKKKSSFHFDEHQFYLDVSVIRKIASADQM